MTGRLAGQEAPRPWLCLPGIVVVCLMLSSFVRAQVSETPLEVPGLPVLDALADEIKARPVGAVDGLIEKQIEVVTERAADLRRTTERLELQQRRCGSQPTGPCRSALIYLKEQRDRVAAGLRMDRLKLRALYAERGEALRRRGVSDEKSESR